MDRNFKYLFIFLLLTFCTDYVLASDDKSDKKIFTDSIDYTVATNLIYPFYQLSMINDLNPVLGQISNDEGYTLGISHRFRIIHNKKQRFYDITLVSDLYTDYHYKQGYSQNGKWIVPQSFTEISSFSFSFNQFIPAKKIFASIEAGAGVRNKNRPIWGMALYLQGGDDGKGGYHSMLNMHANENLVTGEIKPFFYIAPSIRKQFIYARHRDRANPFYLDLQTGFSLGTSQIKSSAYVSLYSELPVLRFSNPKREIFKMSAVLNNLLLAHSSGVQFNPELGVEFRLYFLSMGYTSIFYFGKQNTQIIDYYDNEPLMRAYLKLHF